MKIRHNIPALSACRNNYKTQNSIAKSLEKLSSGYRINRAADDAAGLAISEKMRMQVTGLKQGQQNISDGISLVQTAEGAMDEMTAMLHRLTELTLQAYNGTYSRSDRQMMQEEVGQVIDELGRIAETTNFNGIPLLQGNPVYTVTVGAGIPSTMILKEEVQKELPAWLQVDDKLEVHPGYQGTQDTDGLMFQKTPNGEYIYYGPDKGEINGYKWAGDVLPPGTDVEWTSDIADNPSAKIDFSGLANSADAKTLYNNLFDLIGCSIGIPCGTCNDTYYGLGFGGNENGYKATAGNLEGTNLSAAGNFDLSEWKAFKDDKGNSVNCFEKAMSLIQRHADPNLGLTDAQKAQETSQLAQEIAKALRDESLNRMESAPGVDSHFDRAIKDGDYSIIVYDYRDDNKLTAAHAADATVKKQGTAYIEVSVDYLSAGVTADVIAPIEIVCSTEKSDVIPIDLPDVTLEKLGLLHYNIAQYERKEHYSEEYQQKLDDWEQNYHYETVKKTETYEVITSVKPAITIPKYVNGEKVGVDVLQPAEYKKETRTREVSYQKKVYDSPKPTPQPGDVTSTVTYNPSDVTVVEDALAYLTSCRGSLGAVQNRLEHAQNINGVATENLEAAESRIRDLDMAKGMMQLTKLNILAEAGNAMMAHANQSKASILSMLER